MAELSGKELYDVQKAEKEKMRAQSTPAASRKSALVKWVVWAVILAALVAGGYVVVKRAAPQGQDYSTTYAIVGRDHIAIGAAHIAYNSNPPSSGPHYAQEAREGFYDVNEVVPDEQAVHNLEHGHIWIAYKPTIPDAVRTQLRAEYAKPAIVVASRAANSNDIALVAWGRVDTFGLVNGELTLELKQRVDDFIKRYQGKGPEQMPPMEVGGIKK